MQSKALRNYKCDMCSAIIKVNTEYYRAHVQNFKIFHICGHHSLGTVADFIVYETEVEANRRYHEDQRYD